MKPIPYLVIFSLLLATTAQAQTSNGEFRERLSIGPKAGINISNVYDSRGENFEAEGKVGFAAGVFLAIPIGPYLGVQPEVLFSQKGFTAQGSILGARYEFQRTTNHIDIPLLVAFKPAGFITILAGPSYSFLLSQRNNFDAGVISVEQEQELDDVNIRRNTLGFTGGIDFNMMNFVLGTRVAWDLQNNHGDGSSTTPRYKNTWFQLTLGFRF